MPMQKKSTLKQTRPVSRNVSTDTCAPAARTITFIRQFARTYTCIPQLPAQLGAISANWPAATASTERTGGLRQKNEPNIAQIKKKL